MVVWMSQRIFENRYSELLLKGLILNNLFTYPLSNIGKVLLLSSLTISMSSYSSEDNLISLNLGLSSFGGSSLGANVEVAPTDNVSFSFGTGTLGGYSLGARLYRNTRSSSPYLGVGYGLVEVNETDIGDDEWKEEKLNGAFFVVGYRGFKENGDHFSLGLGLSYRMDESEYVDPNFGEDDDQIWISGDFTYGFTF
jgi:hypothetical protein